MISLIAAEGREADTYLTELSCSNGEKYRLYQEEGGLYIMYEVSPSPVEPNTAPISVYYNKNPQYDLLLTHTTPTCPDQCPNTPPRSRDILFQVREYDGIRAQYQRVGVLTEEWSVSRQATPPPYVTMDRRRRSLRSADINVGILERIKPEGHLRVSQRLQLVESTDTPLPESPPAPRVPLPSPPILPSPTTFPTLPSLLPILPNLPPHLMNHPINPVYLENLLRDLPSNSSESSSNHDMDRTSSSVNMEVSRFSDDTTFSLSNCSTADITNFKADISYPHINDSSDQSETLQPPQVECCTRSPVLTPLVAECYRDYLAAVERLRASERAEREAESALQSNGAQANPATRPRKLAKNPKKVGDKLNNFNNKDNNKDNKPPQ